MPKTGLADHSLVARAGEEQFHPAGEDPELASLFQPVSLREAAVETAPASRRSRTASARAPEAEAHRRRSPLISSSSPT